MGLRWQIPVVLFVTFLIAFLDRMNISIALPQIARDYHWSIETHGSRGGLLMSAFYVAYGLANILLSPLAARIGPKKSLIIIVILFSFFTVISGPLGLMFFPFLMVRILLGVSEAVHVPMINVIIKRWFPINERSRANAIWLSGLFLANVLAPIIVVPMVESWGWRMMFIVLGIAGMCVSLPLVVFFLHDSPEKHPKITPEELAYIQSGREQHEAISKNFWPDLWLLLRNRAFVITLIVGIINSMIAFGLFSWIPSYFTEGRGLKYSDLDYATSIPYAFSVVGLLFWAWMGDRTGRRALIPCIGYFVAGVTAYFAATAPSVIMVIILFCLTIFISVTWAANEWAILQSIVPESQMAVGSGIYNGVAMMVGGGLGPVIVGTVVAVTGNFTYGILSLTTIFMVGGLVLLYLNRLLAHTPGKA
jgi:MFS family permease